MLSKGKQEYGTIKHSPELLNFGASKPGSESLGLHPPDPHLRLFYDCHLASIELEQDA